MKSSPYYDCNGREPGGAGMKKINSIHYGPRVIGIGAVFLAVIPAAVCLLNRVLGGAVPDAIMYVSVGIGALMMIAFFCLLAIELRQDRIIERYYQANPSGAKEPQQILDERRKKRRGT